MDYKSAGVDVEKGDLFVERIKKFIGETYTDRVVGGVGGFAALYSMDDERMLAAGTDGVGTKVKLAQELNIHHTIGQDLVAMCVNDVICTGARPLFFLDYLASGKLDLEVHSQLVEGIAKACKDIGCALIGGETAEMPGVYDLGVYDLAGFCVGEVYTNKWLKPERVKSGDTLIGLASSGFHSNGFSLVRKLISSHERQLMEELLVPTRLYSKQLHKLLQSQPENIHGVAHITGGGFHNIPRMNEALGYQIEVLPSNEFRPSCMNEIIKRANLSTNDLYGTFNMGIGLVLACGDPKLLIQGLTELNEKHMVLGKVSTSFEGLRLL